MKEQWKPIEGYENLYEISDLGNVKSAKGKVLRQHEDHQKYAMVVLYLDKKPRKLPVHRLMATVFLDNWEGKRVVRHKDGNKKNNVVRNLEWVEYSDCKIGKPAKPVVQLGYSDWYYLRRYKSVTAAADALGIYKSCISAACRHKMNSCGGYRWMFESEYLANKLS